MPSKHLITRLQYLLLWMLVSLSLCDSNIRVCTKIWSSSALPTFLVSSVQRPLDLSMCRSPSETRLKSWAMIRKIWRSSHIQRLFGMSSFDLSSILMVNFRTWAVSSTNHKRYCLVDLIPLGWAWCMAPSRFCGNRKYFENWRQNLLKLGQTCHTAHRMQSWKIYHTWYKA